MLNIAVLVSGGGTNLQSIIDASESKVIAGRVSLVISNKKGAYGLERAKKHGIESFFTNSEEEMMKKLEEKEIDLVVLAGFLKILGSDFIREYEGRIINIHPSLIPSFCGPGYYGRKVHEAVYQKGVKISGATTHFVNEHADEGPIILQKAVSIDSGDSIDDIQQKVLKIEHKIMVESIRLYCENKLKVEDERVIILE